VAGAHERIVWRGEPGAGLWLLSFSLSFRSWVILLIASLFPSSRQPPPARVFRIDDEIRLTHRPGRRAVVRRVWSSEEAEAMFPLGVTGAPGPPYVDGVVEARFPERDAHGREYPDEIVAGTYVQPA
jgi:hypothetical protein